MKNLYHFEWKRLSSCEFAQVQQKLLYHVIQEPTTNTDVEHLGFTLLSLLLPLVSSL
jgi:hypothetical protein